MKNLKLEKALIKKENLHNRYMDLSYKQEVLTAFGRNDDWKQSMDGCYKMDKLTEKIDILNKELEVAELQIQIERKQELISYLKSTRQTSH